MRRAVFLYIHSSDKKDKENKKNKYKVEDEEKVRLTTCKRVVQI